GGHVALTTAVRHGKAVVSVRDDGAGIPADMLDSVFDLFVQSTRTLDRSAGGLGVGLTLVRALLEMHGGKVTAHSEGEGKGSEFVVELPLADGAVVPEVVVPRMRKPLRKAARIVIVEDNVDTRELLCQLLIEVGFECEAAASGAAALALIEKVQP